MWTKRNIIAPTVLVPFVWGGLLFLYNTLNHGMYALSGVVYCVILLWVVSFYFGALIFEKLSIVPCITNCFYQSTLNVYYKIVFIATPLLIYIVYKIGLGGNYSFFANIRLAAVGMLDSNYNIGILNYVSTLALVTFLIELYQSEKRKNKKRVIILFFFNIIAAFSTMAKTSLIYLFVCSLIVLIFKWGRISWKKLLLSVACIIAVFSLFQVLRNLNETRGGSELIYNMLNIYILGGMPAFDALVQENTSSPLFGANSFSFFYKLMETFTGMSFENKEGLFVGDGSGYAMVPFPTNVFTVFAPFYKDFGLIGVLIFGFITGALAGSVYRLARKQVGWAVIFYSYIACALLLEFFSDFIFLMLSQTIQFFFISFFAYRFRWKVRFFPMQKLEYSK